MDKIGDSELRLFRDQFGFHPLAIQDCAESVHFPKVDDYGNYLYLVLHAIDNTAPAGQVKTHELDAFLGPNYLITFHDSPVEEVADLKKQVREKSLLLSRGPDFLLQELLERIITNYFPRLEAFEERVNDLEDIILDERKRLRNVPSMLFEMKREVIAMKRVIYPQRELFLKLSRPEFPQLVSEHAMLYFRDNYDHIYRIGELVDGYREMLTNLFEAHYSIVSFRLNDIVRTLTLFTTILMPMTVISGIYGMNFDWMPLLHTPSGFWISIGTMAAIATVMITQFRKRGWL